MQRCFLTSTEQENIFKIWIFSDGNFNFLRLQAQHRVTIYSVLKTNGSGTIQESDTLLIAFTQRYSPLLSGLTDACL